MTTMEILWVGAGEGIRKSLPRGLCDRRILVTTKTEYGWWNIFSRTREHHNHPQTIRTVIASAPYRYRSFSRGRTHMDLDRTPVVWVKRISDYPPHFLNFKRGSIGSVSFSDAMCLESLDSGWTCYSPPVGGLVYPENTTLRLII